MKRMLVVALAMVFVLGMSIGVCAEGNSAGVEQIGQGLEVTIEQAGVANNTNIYQEGSDEEENYGRLAFVKQFGLENVANISQSASNFRAIVDQNGNRNYLDLSQATGSNAVINQSGNDNTAVMSQFGPSYWHQDPDLKGDILTQNGNNNSFYGLALFESNWVGLNQSESISNQIGNGNIIRLQQNGMSNSFIYQNGSYNEANVFQGDQDGGYLNSSSLSDIYQYGNNNTANTDQRGTNQEAYIYQGASTPVYGWLNSSGNVGNIIQENEMNFAGIAQYRKNNVASIEQYEGNNWAGIYQNGIRNNSSIIQTGGENNNALINQLGNNDYATVNQDGNDNNATINQSN